MQSTKSNGWQRPATRGHWAAPLLTLAIAASCGDTATIVMEQPASPGPDLEANATEPAYGVVSRITRPGGTTTVVAIVDSLDPGEVSTENALEVPGFAAAHASPFSPGAFFVASGEAPELARYDLQPNGSLEPRGSFSLANFGLSRAPRTIAFVSSEMAYAIAPESYRLFVWDPQQMEIERSIDLSLLTREGHTPAWVFRAAIRDGELLVPITWVRTDEGDPGASTDSAVVAVDVATDEVRLVEEGRCGGLRAIYSAGNTGIHFSSSAGAPATWYHLYGERGGSAPCIVRWSDDEPALDDSFLLRPMQLLPNSVPVDFSPAGNDHLIFQALDPALAPSDATDAELWDAAAWRFWSVPVEALTGGEFEAEPVDLPASALNALRFELDGRNFVPAISEDYAETTVVDITDPRAPAPGPSIAGSVGGMFRIR